LNKNIIQKEATTETKPAGKIYTGGFLRPMHEFENELKSNDHESNGLPGKFIFKLKTAHEDNCKPLEEENNLIPVTKPKRKLYAVDATADSIVDSPFTETYGSNYREHRNENRRDNKKILLDD
jgi:hypothetical protein